MKSIFKTLLLAISILLSSTAFADPVAFTQAEFDSLKMEGKSILIEVHAPWCPTCRAQAPIVNTLLKRKEFQPINVLRVDFDNQKEVLRSLKATKQSTLIVFKGTKEVGRSTGDTSSVSIEKLLLKAI